MNYKNDRRLSWALHIVGIAACISLLSFRPIDDSSIAIHVDGLSSVQRDQLMVEVALDPALEIAYACVPAGILVFNATDQRSDVDLRADVARLLEERNAGTISYLGSTQLDDLQAQCAQYR